MILEGLIVHNFGLYRGRQTLLLPEPSVKRPITTLVALNGSGKTTLLDALRLGFYGRRSPSGPRSGQSYEQHLLSCIHRHSVAEGAAIEIHFRLRIDGSDRSYRLHRSWAPAGKGVRERLQVYIDGVLDASLTQHWAETIEQWLPVRLSAFCFFDGEQLEALADPDRSQAALRDAVQTLLGLDIVDQLGHDLKALERRQREDSVDDAGKRDLAPLKTAVDESDAAVQTALHERAQCANTLARVRSEKETASQAFAQAGGELAERRNELERAAVSAKGVQDSAEQELRQLASGVAPLLLLREPLKRLTAGNADAGGAALVALLETRDQWLATQLASIQLDGESLAKVEQTLAADRSRRLAVAQPLLDPIMAAEVAAELASAEIVIRMQRSAVERARMQRDDADQMLARLPAEETIRSPKAIWEAAVREFSRAEVTLEHADQRLHDARSTRTRADERYRAALESQLAGLQQSQRHALLTDRIEQLRGVLDVFRRSISTRHATRLGDLIGDCFAQLHRKQGWVTRVTVDPETYSITLHAESGEISAARLSAGERQLLAIATVWAILRASGRPLPLIMDTPLGRLDSVHRQALLMRFCLQASHQVVLLATDTEINEGALESLAPFIARQFEVHFDPRENASRLIELGVQENKPLLRSVS